jgi:hypothetical protein
MEIYNVSRNIVVKRKSRVSRWMNKGSYGTKTGYVYPKIRNFEG